VTKIFIKNRLFDEQQPWTISSIINSDNEEINKFYRQNQQMLDNQNPAFNGRLYKPFVIQQGLKSIDFGDYLVYNDVSPEIWPMKYDFVVPENIYDIQVIKNLCIQSNDFLVAFVKWSPDNFDEYPYGIHTHRYFTTYDCINRMHKADYIDSFLCASGMICIRKTEKTMTLVNEWLYWNSIAEISTLPKGYPDTDDDTEYWKDSVQYGFRHDQSILSLLLNERNWDYVDIVYNDMHPYNFLNFCLKNHKYSFINSNIKI
jgi:hypothetical protein